MTETGAACGTDEFPIVCVTNDVRVLGKVVWNSLSLIWAEMSIFETFWALLPWLIGIAAVLWFLSKVQWKAADIGDRRSDNQHRGSSRGRSYNYHTKRLLFFLLPPVSTHNKSPPHSERI